MSMKDNYEKVLLGVGIGLAALTGAYFFYQSSNLATKYSDDNDIAKKNVQLEGVANAQALVERLKASHELTRPQVGKQHFDVFVGPVLYNKTGETTAIDIYDSKPVHPPIPNVWFIENGLMDDFVMSDAAQRDSDGDGFNNLEEYEAKTNPSDPGNYPDLLSKLSVADIKARGYLLAFSSDMDPDFQFRADLGTNNLWKQEIKKGQKFGKAPDPDRFELVNVETKIEKTSTGDEEKRVATVKDLKPEKKGATYEIPSGTRNAATVMDLSVVFNLDGGKEAGSFTVEEGNTFTLPGDPKKTVYAIESIDRKAGTVIIKPENSDTKTTLKAKN